MLSDNIHLAFSGLWANKMRALLTMLGIIIGIGSVIAIVTVGNSMTNSITTSMQSMGANNITVSLQQKSDSDVTVNGSTRMFRPSSPAEEDLITDEMIEDYKTDFADEIYAISITESVGSGTAASEAESGNVTLTGVNTDYATANDVKVMSGRFLNDADNTNGRKVAVISNYLALLLFNGQDPVGQPITVTVSSTQQTFYIVGVYSYTAGETVTEATDDTETTSLYIPINTAKKLAGSTAGYQSFTVVANTGVDTTSFLSNTQSYFETYYLRNDSYTVGASSMESMVETMSSMMSTISTAIAAIAAISLLVGGIGVMNIMLVSITERTREIGTRKALGATNGSIRFQFIVESVIICLVGGVLGIILGVSLGALGAHLLGYSASASVPVILASVLFSASIGIFFGYYPANKAAKLDPIEALRYE